VSLVQSHIHSEVSLAEVCGEWHVLVKEGDNRPIIRTFEVKEYAISFAEGQKARLGLEKVTRI
jgi:hypothetical protein